MKLQVLRFSNSIDSTHGALFEITETKREFLTYTLEDEKRDKKIKGETRIPDGIYEIQLKKTGGFNERYSTRFADIHIGMLHIVDVPNFEHILIHCGNTDEDTSGCLLLGDTQKNNKLDKNGFIGHSTQAYFRVYPKIANAINEGECVTIEYKDISLTSCKCL
tara:strand:- start:533 stop:1021 length:489 start_codon:yes stop_codon:yes gene_type:complete